MIYGVFSDIHANLEALEAVMAALRDAGAEAYLCGGDIVGYGADPSRCIEIVRAITPHVICGNHDRASCGLFDTAYFNKEAQAAVFWTRDALSEGEAAYLASLPHLYRAGRCVIVHGSLQSPEEFNYIMDRNDASGTMDLMDVPVCFVGHTHAAGIFVMTGDKITNPSSTKITVSSDSKYLVNVGSVGQPRDGDNRAAFAVFDDIRGTIEIRRVPYDIKKAQDKIIKALLPPFLAYRLQEGR